MEASDQPGDGPSCSCKIGRAAGRYGLTALDDDLVRRWTRTAGDRFSTRQLARYVNESILRVAMERADVRYRDGEVENVYRLLTDDGVSSGTRVETRTNLERDGVPVERVESDFVSHQTVHNHLTGCLGASLAEPSDEERRRRGVDRLGALRSRTAAVTSDTIDQLERADLLSIGEYNVLVTVSIACENCHGQFTARTLLERGGCHCDGSSES
ncbi:rod-determining factor RdfA [Halovivax sp.]|uniref:rod-determining factor RdfA n=1 Tax=Halovivax sp. TaxID=1935978 RepID=UPI0025C7174D|nr:rod-determining factor RdfA [Halovivax sp.]